MLTAADVMTTQVGTVYDDTSIHDAAELMLSYGVSGVPVLAHTGELIGILTDADVLRRVELGTEGKPGWLSGFFRPGHTAEDYSRTHGRTVAEVMTRDVVSVDDDAPLSKIVQLMQSRGIKRLPVLRDARLVGIVSRMDLLRALTGLLPHEGDKTASDPEIQKRFFSELAKQEWAPRVGIGANVDHGIIRLDGVVSDERERTALKVLAENTAGCCGVRDHLVCVEPMSGAVVQGPSPD